MKTPKLPNKPSALIKLALKDLAAVEKMKKTYTVDMSEWHTPQSNDKCAVCLAGSVMARTLKVPKGKFENGLGFPPSIDDKLEALDEFRKGWIWAAFNSMGRKFPETIPHSVPVTPYEKSKTQFKKDMRAIVKMLEKAGL